MHRGKIAFNIRKKNLRDKKKTLENKEKENLQTLSEEVTELFTTTKTTNKEEEFIPINFVAK